MKKILILLLLIVSVVTVSLGGVSAFAYVSLEDCDRCFQSTVSSLLNYEEAEGGKVSAIRKPVYDITLEHLGYAYEFEVASGSGYAIIICDNGNYVAQEFFTSAQSPYASVSEEEQCVYVSNMSYYKAVAGEICDISTGDVLPQETVEFLTENAVLYQNSGTSDPEYVKVEVNLTNRSFDGYDMSLRFPIFCGINMSGGCAAVAGGNVIGYFDRYYEDLIPNHSAGYTSSGYYVYNLADTYVYSAIDRLYDDMNGTPAGISESNFKNGLKTYCSRLNLSCDFTSLMSGGQMNFSSVKSSMKAGKPVVMFLSTYNICDITTTANKDTYSYELYPGNHVMVGFTYRDITYTLQGGGTSNYRMLKVATGFGDPSEAYFNIDYSTNINAAYGAYIH